MENNKSPLQTLREQVETLGTKLVDRDTNFGMNESYRTAIDDVLALIDTLEKEQTPKGCCEKCWGRQGTRAGGGWFVVMATLPTGQISNHYEMKDWDLFHCESRTTADKWDGHTPQDVAQRLRSFMAPTPTPKKV